MKGTERRYQDGNHKQIQYVLGHQSAQISYTSIDDVIAVVKEVSCFCNSFFKFSRNVQSIRIPIKPLAKQSALHKFAYMTHNL